jgi:hypothetical protein
MITLEWRGLLVSRVKTFEKLGRTGTLWSGPNTRTSPKTSLFYASEQTTAASSSSRTCKANGKKIRTWLQLSIAYTYNQNGVVERAIRTIVELAVSILSDAKTPGCLWYEICLTITYLGNLETQSSPPRRSDAYSGIHGKETKSVTSPSHRVKGTCPNPKGDERTQVQASCSRWNVGYDGVNQYRMWAPEMNAIVWGRNVTLDEDNVVYEKAGRFEEDEEGLGKLILTDPDEIKDLADKIDHGSQRKVTSLTETL